MIGAKMDNIRNLILDMDGVLYRGNQPIKGLSNSFHEIHRRDWNVVLATNNSTRTPKDHVQKLRAFGVSLNDTQIINSAEATAEYIKTNYPHCMRIYMIGENGLKEALLNHNFIISDDEVDAVVVGLDRSVNYEKLAKASFMIQNGALFIGTNPDDTIPTPQGIAPGAGTIIRALEVASSHKAEIVGKPKPMLFEIALNRLGSNPENTLVVGDRIETDIAGGKAAHCKTALVLSGVTKDVSLIDEKFYPDIIADNLEDLIFNKLKF